MARFTKQVEFSAYQFNPVQLRGLDDYDIEDIIVAALSLRDGVKSAFVTDAGKLNVVIYTYGRENSKEHFELSAGEWLMQTDFGDFVVVADENFRGMATTPVS